MEKCLTLNYPSFVPWLLFCVIYSGISDWIMSGDGMPFSVNLFSCVFFTCDPCFLTIRPKGLNELTCTSHGMPTLPSQLRVSQLD